MRSTEKIKKLIKNLNLHIDTNSEADQRVLGELLQAQEKSQKTEPASASPKIRRQKMSDKSRAWKVAAVVAVVIGAGALATTVGLKVRKLYFQGRESDGTYIFQTKPETVETEDGRTVTTSRTIGVMVNPNETIDVDQKIKDLEEIGLLRQQDDRELIRVTEKEVNGKPQPKSFGFKYVLSDGREETIGEGDPDTQDRERSLTEEQREELLSLRLDRGKEEYIGIEEKQVRGRMFVFKRQRFVLSDGTEVIISVGRPSEDSRNSETTVDIDPKEAYQILNDKREIANLRKQDKRKLIGVDELVANGKLDRRVFVYQYQLSDGRTMDLREGDELNFALNSKQRQEWVQCKNRGSGEDLGTYEEKVKGLSFVFKRQRFVLSDGTEVTWSYGTPEDDQ